MPPRAQQTLARLRKAIQQSRTGRHLPVDQLADACAPAAPATPEALLELILENDYENGLYQNRPDSFHDVDEARVCVTWLRRYEHRVSLLQQIGFNSELPWYVTQQAFATLADCPREELEAEFDWLGLMSLLDSEAEGEVKAACLDLLVRGQRQEALPRLQALQDLPQTDWFDGQRKIVLTRAALGDNGALLTVVQEIYNPWTNRSQDAHDAMAAAAGQLGGPTGVARAIAHQSGIAIPDRPGEPWLSLQAHPQPAVARWATDHFGSLQLSRLAGGLGSSEPDASAAFEPLLAQLSNEDWGVRITASQRLSAFQFETIDEALTIILQDAAAPRRDRSWAAYTLLQRGTLASAAPEFATAPSLRVIWQTPWDFSVPQSVRDAVVLKYAPESEEGADIRYRLEHNLLTHRPDRPDVDDEARANMERESLLDALDATGIAVTSVEDCGEAFQQGGGSYWILQLGELPNAHQLYVSTLGPFVCFVRPQLFGSEAGSQTSPSEESTSDADPGLERRCREVVQSLGMVWLEGSVLQNIVPGLCVYFFGRREPLPLQDLLFYWQD